MNAKYIATTVLVTGGLLFLAGSGCSDDDKNAQLQQAALQARLNAKEAELKCKVAALSIECKTGDTSCTDNRAKALAECDRLAAEAEKNLGGGATTTTVTNTGSNTSTSTNTGTGT